MIFGEFAGLYIRETKTLSSQRVIAQSGSALDNRAVRSTPNAEPFITNKGCERASNQIKCLRDLTTRHLEDDDTSAWQPVIDRDFLIASQQEISFGNDTHTYKVLMRNLVSCGSTHNPKKLGFSFEPRFSE
ncbi:hypothetical protein DPMN_055717 [Dreissena polymorpha]|uniref:Uncharacterized protein n=1 Tax=Dreissena polymorpha TaxID=45954 RepID=A0A9D4CQG2_DREPO|nr:hypothetical protein DPMN_055717 [Dreissena polymorpha]